MQWSSPEYQFTQSIYEDEKISIFRAKRIQDNQSVIIKTLAPHFQNAQSLERLKNAYRIGKQDNLSCIIKPLALDKRRGHYALITEDFEGVPLSKFIGCNLTEFLKIAIKLSEALAHLHAQGIIHKNIKPSNIIIHPRTFEIKLTDLELASVLPASLQVPINTLIVEGSLAYMAPEQTGRTNHMLDARTDLYEVGITLYELRSGKLPFLAKDPLEWIHAHLARTPQSLLLNSPETPPIIAAIINKLLSKVPEERYQSALGLKYDLETCLNNLTSEGEIESFPLGQKGISSQFQIPRKLYGRESEVSVLLSTYEQTVASSKSSLMLVSGYSGIGKTALVKELNIPIAEAQGFFINGKFDQYKRGIPYSMISQAFQSLILQILSMPKEGVEKWKNQIQTVLGIHGQLIVELIPELEFLIGKQPDIQPLPMDESERRFRAVFRDFLNVFTKKEHPVAFFLDDLQWADLASLNLIKDIMTSAETKYLFLIGAYRDNEVGPSHPLISVIEEIEKSSITVKRLVLKPLSFDDLLELVCATVHRSKELSYPLANLIYQKTGGNPFFTIQFLTTLNQEKYIWFNFNNSEWNWDLKKIKDLGYTENIIDLMVHKISKNPTETQEALANAACIGNTFDIRILAKILNFTEDEMHSGLWESIGQGLVSSIDTIYKFAHDRIQQSARLFLSESQQQSVHLQIGRILLRETPEERVSENVFDIVNHLNLSVSLIESQSEKTQLAELNLIAAAKAETSAAYGPATEYAEAGISLLEKNSWQENHDLTFSLNLKRAQNQYLNKQFQQAEKNLNDLQKHCKNKLELAAVCGTGIQLQMNQANSNKAVAMSREFCRMFDIELTPHPTQAELESEYKQVLITLNGRSIESLADLPPMTNIEINALLAILAVTIQAGVIFDERLWVVIACHGVRLSLEYGNSENSSIHYVTLAMGMGAFFEKYQDGYRFGKLAVALTENSPLSFARSVVYLSFGAIVSHWAKPWNESVRYLKKAIESGTAAGNLVYACYSSNLLISSLLPRGDQLDEVFNECEKRLDFVRKAHFIAQENAIITNQVFIQRMQGRNSIDETAHDYTVINTPWPIEICFLYIRKLQASTILGEYSSALELAEKTKPLLWTCPNFAHASDYVFYYAIALTQSGITKDVHELIRKIKIWAENCPANFADRAFLVEAEIERLNGHELEAQKLYEKAILAARENGFVQNEALAFELAAKFYSQSGYSVFAQGYLKEARSLYQQWGAYAKVKQLEQQLPKFMNAPEIVSTGTFVAEVSELDLLSVIKASQAISSEIQENQLIETLLKILMEQSGASSGCLILAEKNNLTIEAVVELQQTQSQVSVLPSIPVSGSNSVPESIIQFVARSHKSVILQNAQDGTSSFKKDPYLIQKKPHSIACLPILLQSKAIGFLYLENLLVSGVFTKDRMQILTLLASQAAISLENASFLKREYQSKEEAKFLSEASSLLSESLDLNVVLQSVAKLIIQDLGDWCEFDIVEDRQIVRRAGIHADPNKNKLLQELAEKYPPTINSPHPSAQVLKNKKPLILSEISNNDIYHYCVDDHHAEIIRQLGTKSVICLPMQTRDRILGALTIGSSNPLQYKNSMLDLGLELSRRTAVTIENTQLYSKAQEAIKIREDFISVASHELKTPVATLKMQTQLILRYLEKNQIIPSGPKGNDLVRLLSASDQQIVKLTKLIDAILDISQMKKGLFLSLNKQEVDLKALISGVLEDLQQGIKAAKYEITFKCSQKVEGHWDQLRLEQVFTNLITNAMKYGLGNPIELSLTDQGSFVQFSIKDNGMGIDKKDQKRIFNIFERAVDLNDASGLGLGLFISKQIITEHKGKIWLESEPGKGSTFYIELPKN